MSISFRYINKNLLKNCFYIDSNINLPKISLEKLNPYQRSLIIGTNLHDDDDDDNNNNE